LTWARVASAGIAVACALIIIAHTPAVLVDPLVTAIAQIRVNAATTAPVEITSETSETTPSIVTSAKKVR
jgi:hypothetical protein